MSDFLNEMEECKEDLTEVAKVLDKFASAHFTLANNTLAKEFHELSTIVFESIDKIEEAVSKKIYGDLNYSQEAASDLITKLLDN